MKTRSLTQALHEYCPFGFPLSRSMWELLDVSTLLPAAGAGKLSSGMYPLRLLADRLNDIRYRASHLSQPLKAGQLFSAGVIVDVLRYIVLYYASDQLPGIIHRGRVAVNSKQGTNVAEKPPLVFVGLFPPVRVMQTLIAEPDYLRGTTEIWSNSEATMSEMILLYLSVENPAFDPLKTLFDDRELRRESLYPLLVAGMEEYFQQQPAFDPIGLPLFQCLRAPMLASPHSLEGQLAYIKEHWAKFLPAELLEILLLASDILREETYMRGLGGEPSRVLEFRRFGYGQDYSYAEPAAFSQDADWMSNVVLIAKTVYVWLDQLSKKYSRHIKFLSDIPDEELDRLARWGFTGLWLIGVWERSPASQRIKQIMGNPEAVSSAYSLYDYVIAEDLGGEEAYQNLRERAWRRGIRLASDMVPNHVGIYSKWVIEHPDWFIQSSYPPFPVYQYNGVDLSWDPRVCIQIEDGYWQHRDAAVVFRRIDKWTGDCKYIYHGNDGTSMPWNDTAQLNFMLPQVREAVIQTILHVARKFPIIRFDAAMTLAKRHFQRLWFPQPGEGGAIPSRAEHGMTKADFDAAFPKEFWREVVDRVAAEQPETLLLAEAFWLMEGYFVRTLGMHRVYNSAFMNMLKMEENSKYRLTVNNVLKFSPEVLKRFVNFMNNPDERTAVEQFGKGDKYFGVALLMVTMPGLPMFGHGQIEGLTEKYGMEYRRAYWDEQVDEEMVRRHEREIFPLMRRRRLFSGADNFALYDFRVAEGWVDENVFAYSNRAGGERAVILYNNAYNTTSGWIHTSTPVNVGTGDQEFMTQRRLAEALALNTDDRCLYAFRDYQSGLEYLRGGRELAERGLFAELHAYQYHAFLDFREIIDNDGSWWNLAHRLNGGGVPSIDEAYQELRLEPVLGPFRDLMNAEILHALAAPVKNTQLRFNQALSRFYSAAQSFAGASTGFEEAMLDTLNMLKWIPSPTDTEPETEGVQAREILDLMGSGLGHSYHHLAVAWIVIRHLGRMHASGDATPAPQLAEKRCEEWLLRKVLASAFRDFSGSEFEAHSDALLIPIMVMHEDLLAPYSRSSLGVALKGAFENSLVKEYLQMNKFDDVLWLNKERFERLISVLAMTGLVQLEFKSHKTEVNTKHMMELARQILEKAHQGNYQVSKLIELLEVTSSSLPASDKRID